MAVNVASREGYELWRPNREKAESKTTRFVVAFALLVSAMGERPVGIQAGQVAAVGRWLKQKYGPVSVAAYGPRTSLIARIAAGSRT